jgi:hypothetical protein
MSALWNDLEEVWTRFPRNTKRPISRKLKTCKSAESIEEKKNKNEF